MEGLTYEQSKFLREHFANSDEGLRLIARALNICVKVMNTEHFMGQTENSNQTKDIVLDKGRMKVLLNIIETVLIYDETVQDTLTDMFPQVDDWNFN